MHARRATDHISLRRLGWMGVVVAGATLPHLHALPLWVPLMLASAIAWRIGARAFPLPLPNRPVRFVLAGIAFGAIVLEYKTINGLHAGSALLVVMMALKYLESRSQRDQLVLMMISYFLVFAGLLYQDTAASGLYLFAFIWITTIGLMQLGRRGHLLANLPTARLAAKLLFQATPIMAVLFLLFPRLPGPLWALPGVADSAVTGLSDRMSPGDITNLGLSDEIAFRVEFKDRTPNASDLYWRGPVLASFNGRTWTRREGMRGDARETLEFSGMPVSYRVMLEPQPQGWIFALEMPSEWTPPRRQTIVMQSDYNLRAFLRPQFDSRFDYDVVSHTQYRATEALPQRERDYYVTLPDGFNPRTRALIDDLGRDAPSETIVVSRALDYLARNEFFYTLTPPPLGRDSIDDFLFETREGFCEHYASAFTVMMRMAGIPARVVTGYQGGELNALGRYFVIRQSNAHAWTEIWLENEGWRRVDPIAAVAPERISLGISRSGLGDASGARSALGNIGWIRQLALAWDALNVYWNNWVVGYGPLMQRALLEAFGLDRLRWLELLSITILATVATLVVLSLYLAWSARAHTRRDPAERCFRRFTRRVARGSVAPRAVTESPVAFGRRLAAVLPARTSEIDAIIDAYLRARYERDPDKRSLTRLRTLVAEFRPTPRFALG